MLKNKETRQDIESVILNSILTHSSLLPNILALDVDSSLFLIPENKTLFNYILDFKDESAHELNVPSLYEYMMTQNCSPEIKTHLTKVAQNASSYNIIETVKNLIEENKEIEFRKIIKEVDSSKQSGLDLIVEVNEKISSLIFETYSKHKGERNKSEVMDEVLTGIENAMNKKASSDYIYTGFNLLDKKIIGIHKKSLTVIAARPGMGKTAFMLQLARNFANRKLRVGIFSIEMDLESLLIRDLSDISGIDSMLMENGEINNIEFQRIRLSAKEILKRNIMVDDDGYQTPAKIKSKINLWTMEKKIDIVLVDYLTLISSKYGKERTDQEIGALTGDFREFSKKTGIPIIMLAQLNRDVEKRTTKIPYLSDLKESGTIEQDARTVLFLYRPAYYGLEVPKIDGKDFYTDNDTLIDAQDYCEIIVAKARNGRVGTVPIQYKKELHRFENIVIQ